MTARFAHIVSHVPMLIMFAVIPALSAALNQAAGPSETKTAQSHSASASDNFRALRASLAPSETSAKSSRFSIRVHAQAFSSSVATSGKFALEIAPATVPEETDEVPVEQSPPPPSSFKALPAAPSVFRHSTAIRYQLPIPSEVVLDLYSPSGRLVMRVDEGMKQPGEHVIRWNGRDAAGQRSASGVYFYRLRAGSHIALGRLLLIR